MPVSTNSIIHYTSKYEVLTKILDEGFAIKYCSERIRFGQLGYSNAAHPMICFCDIPLTNSIDHINSYGHYGIGLSKKWAVRMGINPVLYIDRKSLLAESIYELIKERRKPKSNLNIKQKKEILQIKSYAKNYSGTLKKNSLTIKNYKFYNEREWRLIPNKERMNDASFSIALSNYKRDKKKYNDKIKDIRFKFNSKDISYIIVKHTSEIPTMIQFLRKTYNNSRCSPDELDILISKICSTEQIKEDY